MNPWGFNRKHFHIATVLCDEEYRASGAGSGAGPCEQATAARTMPSFVQNVGESWERASCRKIGLKCQFLVLCQWEICKIWWVTTQQEIFGSETKTVPGEALGQWGELCSCGRGLASLKPGMFLQVQLTPLRAANTFCFVWEVVVPTPRSTELKIPVSLGEARVGSTCWKSQSSEL